MNNDFKKNFYNDVTIIIVTFKSQKIIKKCLDNLDQNIKKIIVENSDDLDFTMELRNSYKNLECINIGYDSGYGYALNRGIEKTSTRYIVTMNPDTFPEVGCIEKIYQTISDKNQRDIAIVAPITIRKGKKEFNDYGYFTNKKNIKKNNILQVDWVNGNILILDMRIVEKIGMYDENIFLQWEERDFQKRIFDIKKIILINFNSISHHLENQSHDPELNYEMKCEVSWHHGWSKFYFFKKHYGYLSALKNTCVDLFSYFGKSIVWLIFLDIKKSNIYRMFFLGLINSILNKNSFYRAKID